MTGKAPARKTRTPATRAVKPQLVGKIPTELKDIGPYVKAKWAEGNSAAIVAVEARLDVGVALNKTRTKLKSNKAYGEWFDNQSFPFQRRQGNNLQRMGANKAKVLKAVKTQIAEGEELNYTKALALAEGKALPPASGNGLPNATPDEPDPEPDRNSRLRRLARIKLERGDDEDPATAEPLPTEPLPKKAKAAPVDMVGDRLNDEMVGNLIVQLETNVIPWIEKGAADGVDEATAGALDDLANFLSNSLVPLCGEIAASVLDHDDEDDGE